MFASNKEIALKEAVELTKAAIESGSGNVPPYIHQKEVAEFVETLYKKLVELHVEAEIED
ncbi:hypothetical protein [uncultured Olegusella sp.]|uniref:hypothetical protein n=1 Tax=uncultured Olegusella sp. TaxID=1979846 RepID=UPI002636A17C|nr:hypothetical protein [uncultured Olegusella sp.]